MTGTTNSDAPGRDVDDVVDLRAQVASLISELTAVYAALDDREVIAQAQGMVMCLANCGAHDALGLLVTRSHADDRTLLMLAAGLVRAHEASAARLR